MRLKIQSICYHYEKRIHIWTLCFFLNHCFGVSPSGSFSDIAFIYFSRIETKPELSFAKGNVAMARKLFGALI